MSFDFFEKEKKDQNIIKILLVVIFMFLFTIIIMIKSFINVIDSKEIHIEVPHLIDNGNYKIGVNKTSKNVYEMWVKVWMNEIGTFSFKNVKEKFKFITQFLDRDTYYQMKKEIDKNVDLVVENFINQEFRIKDVFVVPELSDDRYTVVRVIGKLKRNIGNVEDPLSNSNYIYDFKLYVKNGNIYIKSIYNYIDNIINDSANQKKVFDNKYIHFDMQSLIDKKHGKEKEILIKKINNMQEKKGL